MTKRYVTNTSNKDRDVAAEAPTSLSSDVSIDGLLDNGLLALKRAMHHILTDISMKGPNRESIQNLKDVMAMLHDLKEKEADILKDLSVEELEKVVRGKQNL